MLTANLVEVRRRGGELHLRALDAPARAEALALATSYVEAARAHVGLRREQLDAAWDELDGHVHRRKVALGLRKLLEDACEFEAEGAVDPVALRRDVFMRASAIRRNREPGTPFDREAVLREAGAPLGLAPEVVERALFSDLRAEHVLREVPPTTGASLVEAYELGQAQGILLSAVRVTCEIRAASPGLLRAFFAKLKFLQLLFTAERDGETEFRIVIDGPFSMFESVTRYGLRLALVLPALRALDHWSLVADVRWGKLREPLVFRLASPPAPAELAAGEDGDGAHLSDEVRELLEALRTQKTPWRAKAASTMLDVPGLGVCVPDLVLRKNGKGKPVYVEVLGYWSRDAVFRRVELAERGLKERVVFAASTRLRVSAEVLGDDVPAALYVYKGKMSAKALLEQVDKVASR